MYAPGWQHIKADGPLQCIILVRDGASIPHTAPALHAADLDFDNIQWRHYGQPSSPSTPAIVHPKK